MLTTDTLEIDLEKDWPEGEWYEDRYRGYLDVFHRIATTPMHVRVTVTGAPFSWVPLLEHLQAQCYASRCVFEHCEFVKYALRAPHHHDRTFVEVMANFRPETADALWKIDMQWPCEPGRVRQYAGTGEFIVTTNGAYHRREVIEYMGLLRLYRPRKRKVLLVPCAADKPYPSPLHKECLERLPDDFYLMNATGVVGLVPQELWSRMPHYDSGIPNQWRLYETIKWYFTHNPHDRVVVYCDFYSPTIQEAFRAIGKNSTVSYVLPVQEYFDYLDLMHPERLNVLSRILQRQ